MKKTDQSTQPSRDGSGAVRGSGRSSDREQRRPGVADSVRNAEESSDKNRSERTRPTQDDLILHDDDEAELELPR